MTTGTTLTNLTSVYNGHHVGPRRYRTWSGGDLPASKPVKVINTFTRMAKRWIKVPNPKRGPKYVFVWAQGVRLKVRNPDRGPRYLKKEVEFLKTYYVSERSKPPKRFAKERHPYSTSGYTLLEGGLKYRETGQNWIWTDFWFGSSPPWGADPWSSNDDLRLISKLREAVAGSSFNAAVFLAEGRQSLDTIWRGATYLRLAMYRVLKGDIYGAQHVLSQYTGKSGTLGHKGARSWLELQYGWIPLVSDVVDAAQFLGWQLGSPFQYRVAVTAYADGYNPKYRLSLKSQNVDSGTSVCFYQGAEQTRSKRLIAFLSEVDTVSLTGIMDVSSVVWEKIPYSFAFDWIVPISSYLSARGLNRALTGTFVTNSRWLRKIPPVAVAKPGFELGGSVFAGTCYQYQFSRTVSTSLSVPTPSIKPLNKVLTWKHAANSVALLLGMSKFSRQLFNR